MAAAKTIKTDFPFPVFAMEADRDYILARHTSFLGVGFHSRAGLFCQQACEKYMKAVTVQARGEYLQTHQLLPLAEACSTIDAFFSEEATQSILRDFDYFEQVGRYGAAANFDPLAVQKEETQTAGVMIWKEEFIYNLDAFVFKTRGLLDYAKTTFSDSIAKILAHDKTDTLAGTWKGRPPIYVVLTKNNRYFRR